MCSMNQCFSKNKKNIKFLHLRIIIMSPPEGLGDILFFPGRPSVCLSVCHESCPGGRTGLVVRASDSGSGDPGSILGRVGVLFHHCCLQETFTPQKYW